MATIEKTETWWSLVWWTVMLRGLAAIAFGVLAFVGPAFAGRAGVVVRRLRVRGWSLQPRRRVFGEQPRWPALGRGAPGTCRAWRRHRDGH